jgi:hypothetical protein
MVTGLVSPTECEVKRPMRSLDETGSSLLDPRVSLPGNALSGRDCRTGQPASVRRRRPRAQGCLAAPLTRLRP